MVAGTFKSSDEYNLWGVCWERTPHCIWTLDCLSLGQLASDLRRQEGDGGDVGRIRALKRAALVEAKPRGRGLTARPARGGLVHLHEREVVQPGLARGCPAER
mmetsp:Transcript_115049/g.305895  ORF Transcript_115049/g.305895 Transcript_115049/m.305895 type:complete len:103 (+) Transcript_115049:782-1090(+)